MEIVFDDVTVSHVFRQFRYTLCEDTFTFFSGVDGKSLYDILVGKKKYEGKILGGESISVGYVSHTPSKFHGKSPIEEFTYLADTLGKKDYAKRIDDSLHMVGLDDSYLTVKFSKMSHSEQKRLQLAFMLFYNPKLFILDHFELGFSYKEYKEILKLLQFISKKYHKIILCVSDRIEPYLLFLTNYVILSSGCVTCQGTSKELYNEAIYKEIQMPPIIEFIKMIRDHNVKMENYLETKELIKGIYRDVENQ